MVPTDLTAKLVDRPLIPQSNSSLKLGGRETAAQSNLVQGQRWRSHLLARCTANG